VNPPACETQAMRYFSWFVPLLLVTQVSGQPKDAPAADPKVSELLADVLKSHKVPGVIGAVLHEDRLTIGAAGVRKDGSPDPMRVTDRVHLGSCGKALTATRLALLVEEKKLAWDSTIGGVFPSLKKEIHADWHDVTLNDLLTHRAGLPAEVRWNDYGPNKPATEQRLRLMKALLKEPPASKPGTKFEYSNAGYAIAGRMAEQVTGRSWDDLMRTGLLNPLGMKSAGFGVPGPKGKLDEPWGHQLIDGRRVASQADSPPSMGPAGTIHCTVPDWAKFVALHLKGEQGKDGLLRADVLKYLHTPPPKADPPYMAGWLIGERPWAGGRVLHHAGSNITWFVTLWIAPKKDFAVMAAVNQGGQEGHKASDRAAELLIEHVLKK
jgi:CubicO group peptidase (beta-lactamase class C family)